ncbi:hypothetical protein PC116_g12087 [Phytophthora cactorum]|nr:hypothetical protein Pcac1_g722 [Phytophthora cactorum]KAG4239936.1 hypothetical protein PC116_g12087 [Phytophthora cactorum]
MAANKLWKTAPTKVFKAIKPIVHWGFVPLVVYIALKQEPGLTYVANSLCKMSLKGNASTLTCGTAV